MVNVIAIIIGTIVITLIGGGGAWIIWLKTRPKKETWSARVYQLGEGVRAPVSKNGVMTQIRLQDLRPYAMDVLEKIVSGPGKVDVYVLQKMRKTTPAVTSDVVDFWGEGKKEVSILIQESGCTLLKKGYEKDSGEMLFNPIPHDQISMIENQRAVKKERLHEKRDILQAMTPWIVAGVAIIGLIAVAYIMITGYVEISENMKEASISIKESVDSTIEYQEKVEQIRTGVKPVQPVVGKRVG